MKIIKNQRQIFIRQEVSFRLYSLLKRTLYQQNKRNLGIHQVSAYQHRQRNDFKGMGEQLPQRVN